MENINLPPEHWKNLSLVDILGEEWKDVIGFEGLYQISNMGRVKTLSKWRSNSNNGHSGYYVNPKIIKQKRLSNKQKKKDKYLQTCLHKNNKHYYFLVHRLVAIHFIDNPQNLPEVNHKKGIITDNRASELEWMTTKENMRHAYSIGLKSKGEKCTYAKFTQQQANEIRTKYIPRIYTRKMLAKEYNVSHSAIDNIIENRTYTD